MEGGKSAVSAKSVAAEKGSGDVRRAKAKASKDDDARRMVAVDGSSSQGDPVAEAPSAGIISGKKSKKGIKSGSSRKSKGRSKTTEGTGRREGEGEGEGGEQGGEDLSNADGKAELVERKQSLETETYPTEKISNEMNRLPGTATVVVDDAATKDVRDSSSVSDRNPAYSNGSQPNDNMETTPGMRRAVDKWKKHAFKTAGSRMNLFKVVQTVPSEYLVRARGSEVIQPTVNGLKQFGISKGEISRVVVKFSSPPPPHPLTVCFHFPSTFLTHRYVLDMIRVLIEGVEGSRVTSIQFVDRNTIHGARGLDNRWLVTVNVAAARDLILSQGLQLFNRRIVVRRYDDLLREEYDEYLEYLKIKRRLYNKTENTTDPDIEEEPEAGTYAEGFETGQPDPPESGETLSK